MLDADGGDAAVDGRQDDGLFLGQVRQVLDAQVQLNSVVAGQVLHVVALHHLVVLLHQSCDDQTPATTQLFDIEMYTRDA